MKSNLRRFREEKGLSQTELAYKLGVSQRYVAFLESGSRSPSLKLAKMASKLFGKTIEEIFLP